MPPPYPKSINQPNTMKINHSLCPQNHKPYKTATSSENIASTKAATLKFHLKISTAQSKEGASLPRDLEPHFCLTEKHNCPSPFQGHDKLRPGNCSDLQDLCFHVLPNTSHTGPRGQNHSAHRIRAALLPPEGYRQHL